jgi:hypothetical protein
MTTSIRSGQPTKEGVKNLRKVGIKTIISLRAFHYDADEIRGTGLLDLICRRIVCRDRQNRVPPDALTSDISIPDFR